MGAIARVEDKTLTTLLQENVELIKQTVCKGATDAELRLFLYVCQKVGLDPLSRQIYSIKRGNDRTIQCGIDGYRAIAERTGDYAPGREPSFQYKPDGSIFSCTAYVLKRTGKGEWHEVSASAFFDEYVVKNNPIWRDKPHCMIAKCAESLCLRKAFPSCYAGVYSDDEMARAKNASVDPEPVEAQLVTETGPMSDKEIAAYARELVDRLAGLDLSSPSDEEMVSYLRYLESKTSGNLRTRAEKGMEKPQAFIEYFCKWKDWISQKSLDSKEAVA